MKSRIVAVFALFLMLWIFLVLRGAQLQFIPHEQIQSRQERQFQTVVRLEARRGAIMDRKGRDLALSIKAYSLYADPQEISKPKSLARKLSRKLKIPFKTVHGKLKEKGRRFVWIARKIDADIHQEILQWGERGLGFVPEFKRVYPNEKLLAPVMGFVGMEGQGLEGLELSMDQSLHGQSKKLNLRRDARGRPLILDGLMFAEAPEGKEIQLTIDSEIQHELEKELEKVVHQFNADQAFGVILDVATSELIALAMAPGFDANQATRVKPQRRRNKLITDVFEPGSVMKTFAVAAAIEEGLIQPNTRIDTEGGRMKVLDRWIREADSTHKWAHLTVSEILSLSSNVGTTKIAFKLGDEKLRRYLEDLGFGSKTGIELPGEARGSLASTPWHPHLLSNISFGQGISATPLQVAVAYAAVANGGIWRPPRLIKAERDVETGETTEKVYDSSAERRVFSPETSQALRLMLTGVTGPQGTGKNARVEGFPVGGKTGTAQKVNPNKRGYLEGSYISSFAGFLPAQDPKYVIFVAVDHPKKESYYGSQVAAPVFSRIATFITRLEGWAPVLLAEKNLIRKESWAEAVASEKRVERKLTIEKDGDDWLVPQFRNWTAREVLRSLEGRKIEMRFVGSGLVHYTTPPAGAPWGQGKYLTLYMKPYPRPPSTREEDAPLVDPLLPPRAMDRPHAEPAIMF